MQIAVLICQKCQCHFPNLPCHTPETGSPNLKKKIAFLLCFATAAFVATAGLSAQQAAPSAASGKNMTEEQVNDANVQLMRQDIRSERKKVVAANMPLTETEATKFWPVYDRYIAETIKVNDSLRAARGVCEELRHSDRRTSRQFHQALASPRPR